MVNLLGVCVSLDDRRAAGSTSISTPATARYLSEVQARARRLSESITSVAQARRLIAEEVAQTREALGLSALPIDGDLWAPA
jgi:hypothetical protein